MLRTLDWNTDSRYILFYKMVARLVMMMDTLYSALRCLPWVCLAKMFCSSSEIVVGTSTMRCHMTDLYSGYTRSSAVMVSP